MTLDATALSELRIAATLARDSFTRVMVDPAVVLELLAMIDAHRASNALLELDVRETDERVIDYLGKVADEYEAECTDGQGEFAADVLRLVAGDILGGEHRRVETADGKGADR